MFPFFGIVLIHFIDYAITVVPLSLPFIHLFPVAPSHQHPHLSSCPWVTHISSLASPFPILFLTYPCLFCTYNLCFLFPVPFPPFTPLPNPTDNPPCDLYFCESIPVLVVCLVNGRHKIDRGRLKIVWEMEKPENLYV